MVLLTEQNSYKDRISVTEYYPLFQNKLKEVIFSLINAICCST